MALTPPSNVVATRTSATSVKITWKNGSTSSGVFTHIEVSRNQGAYFFAAQPASGATSWTGTYSEGTIYQFRILHSNGTQDSAYSYSDWVYDIPYPPTNVTATYPEDFKILLSWANAAEEETRPRSRSVVERKEDNVHGEGNWVQILEPLGTSTSWTDSSGIYDNSRYRYRIRAKNKSGYSAYAYSNYIRTHPAMPTCSYSRLSATSMRITIDRSFAPYATGVDIQRRVNGGSWAVVASNTASTSVTDDFGAVDTVQYRVRCTVDGRNSDWEVSEQFIGVVAPNAPTIAAKPASVTASGTACTVRWTPNHPDGTSQTAAQVQITRPSGTASTIDLTTGKTYSFTPNLVGTYSIQVRTKGLASAWGAWSETVSWRMADLPVVSITSPAIDGEVVETMPLTVSWTVTDVSGASSTTLSIVDASTQRSLFSRTYQGSPSSVLLPRTSLPLENETNYTITVQAVNGYGLSASTTRTFSVEWELPAKPSIEVEEGDGKSAAVTVGTGQGSTVPTESITVQRVAPDGSAWTVATGLHSGESAIDPLAPLGVNVTYRAIAYAASGASSENETDARIEAEPTWVVNFGDRAQEYIELKYSPRSSKTLSHGGASYHFADGGAGNGLPVWYGTTDRDVSGSSSFHAIYEETTDKLMKLSDEYPVGWLRDPRGHRVRAHIEPTVSSDFGPVHQIKLNWDAVRWREAWDG